jgi:hypothetical protein
VSKSGATGERRGELQADFTLPVPPSTQSRHGIRRGNSFCKPGRPSNLEELLADSHIVSRVGPGVFVYLPS